jgi:nucleotide-binding universal stress UspA family protein
MKKIIIPTEFTHKSEKALSSAILIAKKMNLSIEVLHVIDSFDYGVNFIINESTPIILPPDTLDGKRDEAIEAFNTLIQNIKKEHDKLPKIDLVIKSGFVFDVISESIQDPNAFMVILNDKSQIDYNYRDISKDNSKIIQSSSCPVCVIPNEAPFNEPKKIIYATNFLEQDIQNIANLANLASCFDAKIYVVHVSENPEFDEHIRMVGLRTLFMEESAFENIKFKTIKNSDFMSGVDHFANEINADMIALMRENKTIFKAFFASNNTKKMVYKTNLPVIIYQEIKD